jgi:hypothetical protein
MSQQRDSDKIPRFPELSKMKNPPCDEKWRDFHLTNNGRVDTTNFLPENSGKVDPPAGL